MNRDFDPPGIARAVTDQLVFIGHAFSHANANYSQLTIGVHPGCQWCDPLWTPRFASATRARSIGTREAAPPPFVAGKAPFAPRSPDPTDKDQGYGKEDRRLHQAADSRRQGEPVAASRACTRSARAEHHAVLQ